MLVRVSVLIANERLSDNDFLSISIYQQVDAHHTFEISIRQDPSKNILASKVELWVGKQVRIGLDLISEKDIESSTLSDTFIGIITSISLSRQMGATDLIIFGQSPTVLLDDGPRTRSFTNKGLQEIIDEVLEPYSKKIQNISNNPKTSVSAIPFLSQYNESNFDFLCRLANLYGEWFFYDGLKLNFGKPSGGNNPLKLNFGKEGLGHFLLSSKVIPNKFQLKGYDYSKSKTLKIETPFNSKTNALGGKVIEKANTEVFPDTPSISIQMAINEDELKNLANRREEVSIDETIVLQGASRNPKIKVGSKVQIEDNETQEDHGVFQITRITHTIKQGGDYANNFEGIPEEIESPPVSFVPPPPFCEPQLAEVTDIDDEESLGRVRVKFLWQEGTNEKSPWIRVSTPYMGKDKGFYIVPEVGDQVLVAFESNNPDKPYVLAGMYHGEAKPEWFDPKNRYKGFKTRGENEWQFDDKEQHIRMRAPKSMEFSAGKKIVVKTDGESDSEITLDAGQGIIYLKADKIYLEGTTEVGIKSTEVKAEGSSSLELKSASVKAEGSASMEIKSATVKMEGNAVVEVKGGVIKLN